MGSVHLSENGEGVIVFVRRDGLRENITDRIAVRFCARW